MYLYDLFTLFKSSQIKVKVNSRMWLKELLKCACVQNLLVRHSLIPLPHPFPKKKQQTTIESIVLDDFR